MADIQLYTGEKSDSYSQWQLSELDKPLDSRLVSQRKGGTGLLKYIEGHDAIDQANRVFGYGNWAYRPLSCDQVVLYDPLTGEAVGIEYRAIVELTSRGAIAPIVDIGSQPVSTWNVEDQIMGRRINDAKYSKPPRPVDESPFTPLEKKNARAVIVDAHEAAKKGAVTDALKRTLRSFGNQFGNGLYGDGRVDLAVTEENTVDAQSPRQLPPRAQAHPQPQQAAQGNGKGQTVREGLDDAPASPQQCASIEKLGQALGRQVAAPPTYGAAKILIASLAVEANERRQAKAS